MIANEYLFYLVCIRILYYTYEDIYNRLNKRQDTVKSAVIYEYVRASTLI